MYQIVTKYSIASNSTASLSFLLFYHRISVIYSSTDRTTRAAVLLILLCKTKLVLLEGGGGSKDSEDKSQKEIRNENIVSVLQQCI